MSAKAKTPPAAATPPLSVEETARMESAASAALHAAYSPGMMAREHGAVPLGTLPAGPARQVADALMHVGPMGNLAFVCELARPAFAGGLPSVTFLIPAALQDPLDRLSRQGFSTHKGAAAGLALALGACGSAKLALLTPALPAEEEYPEAPAPAPGTMKITEMEDAVESVLGLFRLLESSQGGDPSYTFERNSPVWMLVAQAAENLRAAWDCCQRTPRRKPHGVPIAARVLETGVVLPRSNEGGQDDE